MMHLPSTGTAKVASASTIAAAAQQVASGTIVVNLEVYYALSVLFALVGATLARRITIRNENRKLGRQQTLGETWTMTLIAILIVCPLVWEMRLAIPWATLTGLGVGYVTETLLTILGGAVTDGARAAVGSIATRIEPALSRTLKERSDDVAREPLRAAFPVEKEEVPADMRATLENDMADDAAD